MRRQGICSKCKMSTELKAKGICGKCYERERNKKYREAHPTRVARYNRNGNLKRYGIDLMEYNRMLKTQNGECAICGKKPQTYNLGVDHNHATGKVRGLLCPICNYVVGLVENVSLILKAQKYLSKEDKFYDCHKNGSNQNRWRSDVCSRHG